VIFVDANVFIRYLVQPTTSEDSANARRAQALFNRLRFAESDATTSEAVLAEVAFILTSPRHYGVLRSDAAAWIATLIRLQGIRLESEAECLLALDVWSRGTELSYPDALAVAYSILRGYEVATFDRRLAEAAEVTPHHFDSPGESA
jgi:predicted nucleic acid-binding protein